MMMVTITSHAIYKKMEMSYVVHMLCTNACNLTNTNRMNEMNERISAVAKKVPQVVMSHGAVSRCQIAGAAHDDVTCDMLCCDVR